MAQKTPDILTPVERLQLYLPKHCFWDDIEQVLYIDARKVFPKIGVVTVIGWDNMMLNAEPIPDYPSDYKIMQWPKQYQFADWLKQIPKWVQDSCALFPSHQMTLLHYAGKYPQLLELLDHAPMLAWRLVKSGLEEPEIVALMSGKRTQIAESVGWPGKADTIKFLTNLRLRWVNPQIAEQVEICLMDENRLSALQELPRINSMALTLAARFPALIGTKLHQALAQLPCRPMQCKSMVALLEDAYALGQHLELPEVDIDKIGQCRYLVEVSELYQGWMQPFIQQMDGQSWQNKLTTEPQLLKDKADWLALSQLQQHAWFIEFENHTQADSPKHLYAWKDEEGVWGALVEAGLPQQPNQVVGLESVHGVDKVRGLENILAGAKQFSTLHLWQAQQFKQTD